MARGNMLIAANLAITISLGLACTRCRTPAARIRRARTAWPTRSTCRTWCASTPRAGDDIADRYRDLADAVRRGERRLRAPRWATRSPATSRALVERLGPARCACPQVGVPESGIPALVEGAMGDGTTLLNPREPSEADYEELYKRAL